MASEVRVVARMVALPDKIEELKAILLELIPPTRKEAGCIKYELLQNNSDPTDLTFVEEWTSEDALNNHLLSEHIQIAVTKLENLVAAEPDIRRYHLMG
ncbi:antibiotic biosynthesis monooxygenase [Aetokthonos hydrillicola Thurmond2011]|jgi:quinol monooxygenase YgiN|uniref:Antibiotic biosynthesis monooxygenase n=1 Tax=Aetokthonos hydrillicola Thurmond2011 TaxID=2712845 RepID=A0AAP5M9P0_9CYAN|nr:putative quinol monooxygenase [Aetokthonos hydrillicola]MBO3459032.1 antibiotic biosynthesis monooxygenase [Aetokthonos hydrillicola CCALA 1050]MBW4590043.1 antibiotic biosynthesis monooxygenase [Aetokthonos hydrillicola CCALA 1050]MDR9894903.1 antibiotic biosynthesis monooxygenase [Aetokthonos hydrillicola Thurmond2011]